jgi:hypothetical protein
LLGFSPEDLEAVARGLVARKTGRRCAVLIMLLLLLILREM